MRFILQLDLLALEAVALKILEAERLKTAELRLALIEREGKHMCLAPACRLPVVGKHVFAHCERHLTALEKQWLEDDIEAPHWRRPSDDPSEHPAVRDVRLLSEKREVEVAREMAEQKEKAIAEARDLIETNQRIHQERSAFLPSKLRFRINKAYEALKQDYANAPGAD